MKTTKGKLKKPKKTCKLCSKDRYGNTSWCFPHYKAREKAKKEEKDLKKKERKESTKKFAENLRKTLHAKAWNLMSEWVRRKDANLNGYNYCFTCDKPVLWQEGDAGHFWHDRLDFDERNLKFQCRKCNRYQSGNLGLYASRLIKENGLEWFEQLERDKNAYKKYDAETLKGIIVSLQDKLKTL